MSDERLAKKAMEGDISSYEQLVKRYEKPLLRYVIYLIQDVDIAEDCVQDTFIKTYENLRSFKFKLKFSSWIYRIAHNTAMDYVKKKRPIRLDERILDDITAQESGIAARIDRDISASDVNRCLLKLEAKYREPIALYYLQHQSYADISDVLRLPISTVGVRINRAKKLMKDICKSMGVKR